MPACQRTDVIASQHGCRCCHHRIQKVAWGRVLRRVTSGAAPVGRILLGDEQLENQALVDDVIRRGIPVSEYVGAES